MHPIFLLQLPPYSHSRSRYFILWPPFTPLCPSLPFILHIYFLLNPLWKSPVQAISVHSSFTTDHINKTWKTMKILSINIHLTSSKIWPQFSQSTVATGKLSLVIQSQNPYIMNTFCSNLNNNKLALVNVIQTVDVLWATLLCLFTISVTGCTLYN